MELFSDEYFMQESLKEARKAFDKDEVPVGAVVVWNNQVIARSHNLTETLNDVTAHAEMQAFTAAANASGGKYLTDCTLFVTLEPCVMCAGASNWAQISRIVFGADDDKRGYSLLKESVLHTRTTVTRGVLREECSAILKEFFSKKRK
ncbi:MAG: nucleoside deaminase [Bacteroidales bacterium]|nr:nucleoside deaminase [Bacteroidales bacterium]